MQIYTAKNIIGFMQRVQLQGAEVPAFNEAMVALHALANPQDVVEEEKITDEERQ